MRRSRVVVMLVAATMTMSLVGGCGSKPDITARKTEQPARENQVKALAAQEFRNQVGAAMRRKAAQRLARQRRAAASRRAARQRQAQAISAAIQTKTARVSQVLQYFGLSPFDPCGPVGPKGGGKAQRQARLLRELRRKQALRYLNLTCPSR